jgi:hypothetical protein
MPGRESLGVREGLLCLTGRTTSEGYRVFSRLPALTPSHREPLFAQAVVGPPGAPNRATLASLDSGVGAAGALTNPYETVHMSWIAQTPSSFIGQVVGDGQCVAYVQRTSGAPQTALWRRGELVKGGNVPQGTAIATFDPTGVYGNHVDGRSHAAIFHEQLPEGLLVWDQWFNHPVEPRVIRFQNGDSAPANDGDEFYVIEHA